MTRQYNRRDYWLKNAAYCQNGCGMQLTPEQMRKKQKYCSVKCATDAVHMRRAADSKKFECKCGCGETIPQENAKRGYPFVNDKHESAHYRHIIAEERRTAELEANPHSRHYCKHYKDSYCTCIMCYTNGDGKYRGCYEKPDRTR